MAIVASLTGYVNPEYFDVDEIPVITGEIYDGRTDEPHATPLADLAKLDAAGLDGELMSYEEWLQHVPAYGFDPEPDYYQKEYV